MKKSFNTVKQLMIILLTGLVSINVMATNDRNSEDASISLDPSKTNTTVVVRIWNISTTAPATIAVFNKFGNAIYRETVAGKDNHMKRYDFSKLEAGKYDLVLESATGEIHKPFIVGMNGIVREDKSGAFKNFKPIILKRKGTDEVQVLFTNPSDISLSVKLSDKYGRIIHKEEVAGNQHFAKALNLKKLPAGQYTVEVFCQDYGYHQDISIY